MRPSNHQVLNSTIRSCYFVTALRQEARELIGLEPEWRLLALVRIICSPGAAASSSSVKGSQCFFILLTNFFFFFTKFHNHEMSL